MRRGRVSSRIDASVVLGMMLMWRRSLFEVKRRRWGQFFKSSLALLTMSSISDSIWWRIEGGTTMYSPSFWNIISFSIAREDKNISGHCPLIGLTMVRGPMRSNSCRWRYTGLTKNDIQEHGINPSLLPAGYVLLVRKDANGCVLPGDLELANTHIGVNMLSFNIRMPCPESPALVKRCFIKWVLWRTNSRHI